MSVPEDPPGPARPRIHLNCAVSADGRLAYSGGRRALLSGPEDLRRVQVLRAESGGILVGVGTVVSDDPSLRVHWELLDGRSGPSPLRIILDSQGRTPPSAKVLTDGQPTLVATSRACERTFPPHIQRFQGGETDVDLPRLLTHLVGLGVRSVLVEGGGHVFSSFFAGGLFDVFTIYVAPVVIGGPTSPPLVAVGELPMPAPLRRLRLRDSRPLDDGVLLEYGPD